MSKVMPQMASFKHINLHPAHPALTTPSTARDLASNNRLKAPFFPCIFGAAHTIARSESWLLNLHRLEHNTVRFRCEISHLSPNADNGSDLDAPTRHPPTSTQPHANSRQSDNRIPVYNSITCVRYARGTSVITHEFACSVNQDQRASGLNDVCNCIIGFRPAKRTFAHTPR